MDYIYILDLYPNQNKSLGFENLYNKDLKQDKYYFGITDNENSNAWITNSLDYAKIASALEYLKISRSYYKEYTKIDDNTFMIKSNKNLDEIVSLKVYTISKEELIKQNFDIITETPENRKVMVYKIKNTKYNKLISLVNDYKEYTIQIVDSHYGKEKLENNDWDELFDNFIKVTVGLYSIYKIFRNKSVAKENLNEDSLDEKVSIYLFKDSYKQLQNIKKINSTQLSLIEQHKKLKNLSYQQINKTECTIKESGWLSESLEDFSKELKNIHEQINKMYEAYKTIDMYNNDKWLKQYFNFVYRFINGHYKLCNNLLNILES